MIIRGHGRPASLSTVLFDLDDTLLDVYDARIKALQQVFTRAGILHPTAEQFLRVLRGIQLKEALTQFEATRKTAPDLLEDFRRTYYTKKPSSINLYPGVKLVLEELYSRGVKLGVVTQKIRALNIEGRYVGALQELEELGVAKLFTVIVGFEDVSHFKPHPDGVNLALSRLAAQPSETLVVGDSAADIEAALSAGCWSCQATWGIPAAEHRLGSIQADLVAETPEALLEPNLWKTRTH